MLYLGYRCFGCGRHHSNALNNKHWCAACLQHGYYTGPTREQEKQASRDEDQRRLDDGEVTREQLREENGAFAFPNARLMWEKARFF